MSVGSVNFYDEESPPVLLKRSAQTAKRIKTHGILLYNFKQSRLMKKFKLKRLDKDLLMCARFEGEVYVEENVFIL